MHNSSSLRKLLESGEITESLFINSTNTEIGKNFNVSRECVRILRLKYFPNTVNHLEMMRKRANDKLTKNILEYLKDHADSVSMIEFSKLFKYYVDVTRQTFIDISKKYDIKIKFLTNSKYEHGASKFKRKTCLCNICKLSWAIMCRFYKHDLILGHDIANYYANKHYEKYENDSSKFKKEFYSFVESDSIVQGFTIKNRKK